MRWITLPGVVIAWATGAAHAGLIDPALDEILRRTPPEEAVSALVHLADQVNVVALTAQLDQKRATLRRRHEAVVTSLQDLAAATQHDLLAYLGERAEVGTVEDFHPFWISNAVRVRAVPAEIRAIAGRPDVGRVYFDHEIELIEPVEVRAPPRRAGPSTPERGIVAVRAPEVWELGFTGNGVLVGSLDTGVDGNHPALADRWRGVADPRYVDHPEWAWFDPVTFTDFPFDEHGHGTHTMGTLCGGAPGDAIGVAPDAQWIHAATIDRVGIERSISDSILAFEWLLDPDGDPATNWDVPAVCSNSWGIADAHGYPDCDETFWSHLDACEAAGVVIVFAAGNEAYIGLRRPADRASDDYRTLAVGAVDAHDPDWPIAFFSSRGPTDCTPDGGPAVKPDIAAPGFEVRSAIPFGGYEQFSGTSMAAPHVTGVIALLREANPELTVETIKQIIYETAFDLGPPGEDNDYGWGMIDAYEAVQLALGGCRRYVRSDAEGANSGRSWENAYTDLQDALEDAASGAVCEIWVAAGTYTPDRDTGDRAATFRLWNDVAIFGGFAGHEAELDERDWTTNQTILSGDLNGDDAPGFQDYDENSYHVVTAEGVAASAILDGFSVRGGMASGEGADASGAGISSDGSPTLRNCVAEENRALGDGAGMWSSGGNAHLSNLDFERNLATGDGGGLSVSGGSAVIWNSRFVDNGSANGGGLHVFESGLVLTLAEFRGNAVSGNGGALVLDGAHDDGGYDLRNLRIEENAASLGGAIACVNGGRPNITISTLRDNEATADGGAIWSDAISEPTVSISFLCDNTPNHVAGPWNDGGGNHLCPVCAGDVNGDAEVGFGDLLRVLSAWGPCSSCPEDIDGNGDVGFPDVLLILSNWGPCPR